LDLRQPHIKVRKASLPLPPNYVVLFIGGSERWKKWPVQKFVKIGRFVRELGLNVILAGGSSDVADAEEYASMNDGPLLNLVGRTSLCELLSVIAGARMIVSNDTSAPHFAMAVGTPAVVLYNGNHYGRFVPYPSQVCSGYRPVYHPAILKDVEQYKIRSNTLAGVHDLNCDDIRVECVEDEIKAVLNSAAAT
jgi:ADP-heptose:LPS heptosyltransferase